MRKVLSLLIIPVLLVGCAKVKEAEVPQEQEGLHEVVFHAGWDSETRTVLQEDGSVWWSPGDEINMLVKSQGIYTGFYKLSSTNIEPTAKADFVGQIGGQPGNSSYYAIYPYNSETFFDGAEECFSIPIPTCQTAREETFDKGYFVSVAFSDDDHLYFNNLCGGIKFSVENEGIDKITITANAGEALSGSLCFNMSLEITPDKCWFSHSSTLEILAPDGGTFIPGKYYYAVLPAMEYANGLNITYHKGSEAATFENYSSLTIKKSTFKRLIDKDADLTFKRVFDSFANLFFNRIPVNILPEGIDKTTITEAYFHVLNSKTTDTIISEGGNGYEPIYFEMIGTEAHYYTLAEAYKADYPQSLFYGWERLKTLDISTFDVSGATSFNRMFYKCASLENLILGDFENGNATDLSQMFSACTQLQSIDLSNLHTENVTNMGAMFADCWSLESIDLSLFNTSNVQYMYSMFMGCSSLTSLDLSSFDTSNVENMSCMFGPGVYGLAYERGYRSCSELTSLDLSNFNTEKVTDLQEMFWGASKLESLNLSGWDTGNVTSMRYMFRDCTSLESLDLSSFNTERVTDMSHMFSYCTSLKSVDVTSFSTQNVSDMRYMFHSCESLTELDISSFSCSSANYVERILSHCFKLRKLDLGDIDFSHAETYYGLMTWSSKFTNGIAIRCTAATRSMILENGAPDHAEAIIWVNPGEPLPEMGEYRNPDLYYSSDFDMHRKVKQLQSATVGKGVDIVILGDAYSDRLIADGTYENDMTTAIEGLFKYEPLKSYRNFFNVYMVYVVSENESCEGMTAFHITDSFGEDGLVNAFVLPVVKNKPLCDIATMVIGHDTNAFCDPGLVRMSIFIDDAEPGNDYGQMQSAVAYIARDLDETEYVSTVVHEFGHLFAKLADEYVTDSGMIPQYLIDDDQRLMDRCGFGKNIDFTSNPTDIKWAHFISDPRYANECIGAYEGGANYEFGVWRATEESIMRNSYWRHGFNAPSREAIYYRIHKLAYGKDWQYDYEAFVQQDLKNIPVEPYFQSSPTYVPYPEIVNQKHLFKTEELTTDSGRKLLTITLN